MRCEHLGQRLRGESVLVPCVRKPGCFEPASLYECELFERCLPSLRLPAELWPLWDGTTAAQQGVSACVRCEHYPGLAPPDEPHGAHDE